jgi:hypothetical protein
VSVSTTLVRSLARAVGLLPDARVQVFTRALFTRTARELEASTQDVRGAQEQRLLGLLRRNDDTEVGRRYGFSSMRSIDDYRARVPLCTWDDVAPLVERMVAGEKNVLVAEDVFLYASTSGTTGRRKLIPITSDFVAECRAANRVLFRTSLLTFPSLLRGRRLSMRSPALEDIGPGAQAGSITVALAGGFDEGESALDAVPLEVFRVADFESRYFLCLRFAAQEDVRLASAINPSTLLLFARVLEERAAALASALEEGALGEGLVLEGELRTRLASRARKVPAAAARLRASEREHGFARMRDLFPNLAGLACWKGGSAPWYLSRLPRSYGELPVLDYGYAASEGCFGAPLDADGAASVLVPHGHFVELIPEGQTEAARAGQASTVLLHEAEPGQRYDVVVTTGAGLYRYHMNDIVEVTGRYHQAPLVVFRHKGGNMVSLTGEKLGESHVVRAMDHACDPELPVAGFVLTPWLPAGQGAPGYVLVLDAPGLGELALARLAESFDAALMAENEEYEAKRRSLRLTGVRCALLPAGAFLRHRTRRVLEGAPDAHVKVPHIDPDGRLVLALGLEQSAPALAPRLPCRAAP